MLFFFFEMNAFFENQVSFLFLGNLLFRMSSSEAFFLIRLIDPLKVDFLVRGDNIDLFSVFEQLLLP